MKQFKKILIGLAFILLLAACSKDNVHQEIKTYLEATVDIEKSFEEYQESIYELEKQDEEIYNEIIRLGSNEYEEVVSLAKEAVTLLDERHELVKLEKESLEASRTEFENIKGLMDKISNEDELEHTEKMYETMINRYDAYDEVYDKYVTSIQLTKELYTLLQEENLKENELYTLISTVNESYEDVIKANEKFNKETVLYNQLKQTYYELVSED